MASSLKVGGLEDDTCSLKVGEGRRWRREVPTLMLRLLPQLLMPRVRIPQVGAGH